MDWNEPGGEKRNPWNRPQQSQNDLDDVLRNIQRRFSAFFGKAGVGGVYDCWRRLLAYLQGVQFRAEHSAAIAQPVPRGPS